MGVWQWLARMVGGPAQTLNQQYERQQVQLLEFPATLHLEGVEVTIRLLERADRERILEFARALPEHDLLFLRRDITKPENVDLWMRDIDEGRYSTIVATQGERVVGYATVASDQMTWTRHVAELRVLVAPEVRGVGVGRLLTEQAFAIARDRGVRKMLAQMTTDQDAAVRAFERMGFHAEAVLRGQVMDRDGALHDLQIMSLDVEEFEAKLQLANLQAQMTPIDI